MDNRVIYKVFTEEQINYLTTHPIKIYKNYNLIQRAFIVFNFHLQTDLLVFAYNDNNINASYCFIRKEMIKDYEKLCNNEDALINPIKFLVNHEYFNQIELNTKHQYIYVEEFNKFVKFKDNGTTFVNAKYDINFKKIHKQDVNTIRTFYDIFERRGVKYIFKITLNTICICEESQTAFRFVEEGYTSHENMLYLFENEQYDNSFINEVMDDLEETMKEYNTKYSFGIYSIELKEYNDCFNKTGVKYTIEDYTNSNIFIENDGVVKPSVKYKNNCKININETYKYQFKKPYEEYIETIPLEDDELIILFEDIPKHFPKKNKKKRQKNTIQLIEYNLIKEVNDNIDDDTEPELFIEEDVNIIQEINIIFINDNFIDKSIITKHITNLIYSDATNIFYDLYQEYNEVYVIKDFVKSYTDKVYFNIRFGNKQYHIYLSKNYKVIYNATFISSIKL